MTSGKRQNLGFSGPPPPHPSFAQKGCFTSLHSVTEVLPPPPTCLTSFPNALKRRLYNFIISHKPCYLIQLHFTQYCTNSGCWNTVNSQNSNDSGLFCFPMVFYSFPMIDKMAAILFGFPMIRIFRKPIFWIAWTILFKKKNYVQM